MTHPSHRFCCEFGPVFYRGRLDGSARVLVVAQDPSIDELFARRVLVGRSGQRVQGFLKRLGIMRSYVMVNTFLFNVRRRCDEGLRAIAIEPPILQFRNTVLDQIAHTNALEAIIALGEAAHTALRQWSGPVPIFGIAHPSEDEPRVLADWNCALRELRLVLTPDDGAQVHTSRYGKTFSACDLAPIPRYDLPFGMPDWLGTGGTRGVRMRAKRIAWTAP